MKLKYKIFLFTSNHITGNLVRLKLKSFGNDVSVHENLEDSLNELNSSSFDLVVLNDPREGNPLIALAKEKSIPVIFINGGKEPISGQERFSLGLSFTEEDFLHKVSFSVEYNESDEKLSLISSVISHYGGDKVLAQKVVCSFLEVWNEAIEEMSFSFKEDDDKELARKVHSFKGVLSALGETEAAATIRKMEILIKGRNRNSALHIYPELKRICQDFSEELSESALLK